MSESVNSKIDNAEDFVAQIDTGARNPKGFVGKFILALAFCWSLFQLYVASNLPFILSEQLGRNLVLNNNEIRFFHLAFALALAALAYPLFKSSPRDRVPWYDWLLAAGGVVSCLYLFVFKYDIASRAGLPTQGDLIISAMGLIILAIAVFRSLGLPLVIVASVFMLYVFFGDAAVLPDVVQWKGASLKKALWHFWMQTEGVFGVALGVSASMIFLFVLFGSLLEKAGAGNYFIMLAFALLGHLRGGPAKAAVVASALSGIYSGSSIANVVTTGTFTIPLMKRTGFSAEKAGAVEVASSTNGQLMPPVMGAAAFLIAEFTGIAYTEILKHALLPAVISYIALVYIVHLEALKMDLKGLPRPTPLGTAAQRMMGVLFGFIATGVLIAALYFGINFVKSALPQMTFTVAIALFVISYLILIFIAARKPELQVDSEETPMEILPRAGDVALTGLYFLLPIIILIWCILIERLSPTFSAYWATVAMIIIVLTQRPLKALFRGGQGLGSSFKHSWDDFINGMVAGARNMIGIGVATGVAGIIIGTVSLTGAHQVVGELVEFLSGGNLMFMLFLVAIMSLVLGMGLPTTANYIVVSSLMAPVIVSVGAQQGLIVPLIAVHMFVFYFGILADDTPPVGLAAFAAAAISGGDPIRTGIQGFTYDIRTALLPFLFIFNTELLLINVSPLKAIMIFIVATAAMMLFAAATQGYFLTRSRWWESALLLLIAFSLFRPGFWLNQVQPKYTDTPGGEVIRIAEDAPDDSSLRVIVSGPDFDNPDEIAQRTVVAYLPAGDDGSSRLDAAGLTTYEEEGKAILEEPFVNTPFFRDFQMFDFYGDVPVEIKTVQVENQRMPKEIFYLPALLLLALVVLMQRARKRRHDVSLT